MGATPRNYFLNVFLNLRPRHPTGPLHYRLPTTSLQTTGFQHDRGLLVEVSITKRLPQARGHTQLLLHDTERHLRKRIASVAGHRPLISPQFRAQENNPRDVGCRPRRGEDSLHAGARRERLDARRRRHGESPLRRHHPRRLQGRLSKFDVQARHGAEVLPVPLPPSQVPPQDRRRRLREHVRDGGVLAARTVTVRRHELAHVQAGGERPRFQELPVEVARVPQGVHGRALSPVLFRFRHPVQSRRGLHSLQGSSEERVLLGGRRARDRDYGEEGQRVPHRRELHGSVGGRLRNAGKWR